MAKISKILLLEDNPIHGEVLFDELEDSGFVVERVRSVDDARKVISKFQPELLIFDVVIGGDKLSVINYVRELRSTEMFREIPVLFVTAYQSEISSFVSGLSRSEVLDKPFDLETMSSKIRELQAR